MPEPVFRFVFTCYITGICQSCQSAWHCILCSIIYLVKLQLMDSNYFFTTTTSGAVNIFIYMFWGIHASISLRLISREITGPNMHIYILLGYYQITLKRLCFFTLPSTTCTLLKLVSNTSLWIPGQSCSSSVINHFFTRVQYVVGAKTREH